MAYCAYCKTHIFDPGRKCPNCGSTVFRMDDEPVAKPAPSPAPNPQVVVVEKPVYQTVYVDRPVPRTVSEKSWLVTLLLCTFVGVFGFHRFYVGKIGSGVGFLLTGSWFGIGWLVDMISILTGHFRDCEGLKLAK